MLVLMQLFVAALRNGQTDDLSFYFITLSDALLKLALFIFVTQF